MRSHYYECLDYHSSLKICGGPGVFLVYIYSSSFAGRIWTNRKPFVDLLEHPSACIIGATWSLSSPRPRETKNVISNAGMFSCFVPNVKKRSNAFVLSREITKFGCPTQHKKNNHCLCLLGSNWMLALSITTKITCFFYMFKGMIAVKEKTRLQQNQKIRSKLQTLNKNKTKVQVSRTWTISKNHCWWPKSCK